MSDARKRECCACAVNACFLRCANKAPDEPLPEQPSLF